jgi:hypothetical protein
MLMAHPSVLCSLLEQYEALRALHAKSAGRDVRQRLDDVIYTLCVSTGTRSIDAALTEARRQVPPTWLTDGSANRD